MLLAVYVLHMRRAVGSVRTAYGLLKPEISPGLESIFLEFIPHVWSALKSWFCDFLNSCMSQLKIPKIWRRALFVAITKPEKQLGTQRAFVL